MRTFKSSAVANQKNYVRYGIEWSGRNRTYRIGFFNTNTAKTPGIRRFIYCGPVGFDNEKILRVFCLGFAIKKESA